jgi:hypothetical protein
MGMTMAEKILARHRLQRRKICRMNSKFEEPLLFHYDLAVSGAGFRSQIGQSLNTFLQ